MKTWWDFVEGDVESIGLFLVFCVILLRCNVLFLIIRVK